MSECLKKTCLHGNWPNNKNEKNNKLFLAVLHSSSSASQRSHLHKKFHTDISCRHRAHRQDHQPRIVAKHNFLSADKTIPSNNYHGNNALGERLGPHQSSSWSATVVEHGCAREETTDVMTVSTGLGVGCGTLHRLIGSTNSVK
jgi:hypothetical protein